MNKVWVIFLLFFVTASYAKNPVSLFDFCRKEGITAKYNVENAYYRLSKGDNECKVYIGLPYIYHNNRVYYMGKRLTFTKKGEVLLYPEYVEMILSIFTDEEEIDYAELEKRFFVTNINEENILAESKTNQISAPKDEKIDKTVYNNDDDSYQPINMIIIDAGHGGRDPGGIGVGGIKEKEIVLTVSKLLADYLKSKGYKNIVMTRKGDEYVSLSERTDIATEYAKKYNPIFISIHGNISLDKNVSGLEVYSLADNPSDEEAYQVQLIENKNFTKDDVEKTEALYSILGDLAKDELKRESELLAKNVASAFIDKTGASLRGIKKANFYVLKYNCIPSILVEIGFMSHKEESKKLMNADYRKKMAYGVGDGIINFIDFYNKNRGFTQ